MTGVWLYVRASWRVYRRCFLDRLHLFDDLNNALCMPASIRNAYPANLFRAPRSKAKKCRECQEAVVKGVLGS